MAIPEHIHVDRYKQWAVYMIHVKNSTQPMWIGHALLPRVYDIPDTRGNKTVERMIAAHHPFMIEITAIVPSKEIAETYVKLLLATYGYPTEHEGLNVNNPQGRPSKGAVKELATGEEFESASEAASHFKLSSASVSRSLRGASGRIKGKYRFRYIE